MKKQHKSSICTNIYFILFSSFFLQSLLACVSLATESKPPSMPDRPEDVSPIMVGETVPNVNVTTINGKTTSLMTLRNGEPALLIFYRGGWCPYCNTHLADLRKIEKDLIDHGVNIFAISPDLPKYLKETQEKQKLGYSLLSDSTMALAKAFGLAFRLDRVTKKTYKNYGIDLEKNSGESHHLLPVPAAILVDKSGLVNFIFVSPNYKIRVNNDVILAAVRTMFATEHAEDSGSGEN